MSLPIARNYLDPRSSRRRSVRSCRPTTRTRARQPLHAETLALYVRFWLSITPPVPPDAHAAAQAKGRERFDGFVETLGKRLQKGQSFLREIPDDVPAAPPNEEPR